MPEKVTIRERLEEVEAKLIRLHAELFELYEQCRQESAPMPLNGHIIDARGSVYNVLQSNINPAKRILKASGM